MIYFIGAGPGAADLITVRGAEILRRADRVIYAGSLVNPELLDYCPEGCDKLNSASMTLEEVMEAMCACPAEQTVVRLHTGDPSIYGAIREQMDELDRRSMAYEIVPGVMFDASVQRLAVAPELWESPPGYFAGCSGRDVPYVPFRCGG